MNSQNVANPSFNTLLYQCTNLTSRLIQHNEDISKAHRQLDKDVTEIQETVALTHQKFEETLFKIMKLVELKDHIEKMIYQNKKENIVATKQEQLDLYKKQRENMLQELKNSYQSLNSQKQ